MSVIARTNLDATPLGDIDQIFKHDGRHTCPANQNSQGIGVVKDPFGGDFKVCAFHLKSGCGIFGGDRAELLTTAFGGAQGQRLQAGSTVAIPKGFRATADQWNYLGWNFHNANSRYSGGVDVGGAEQSPVVLQCRSDKEIWLHINSGPRTGDGTQGTVRKDIHLGDFEPEKYKNIIMDVYWSERDDGYIAVYLDRQKAVELHCPTLDAGQPNSVYPKFGGYRRSGNGWPCDYYYRDIVAFNGKDASEALTFFGGGPIPEPDPPAAQLVAEAIAELEQTTVGYVNTHWKMPPDKTHWANGLDKLSRVK